MRFLPDSTGPCFYHQLVNHDGPVRQNMYGGQVRPQTDLEAYRGPCHAAITARTQCGASAGV
jgi:hypothetical protein